MSIHKRKSFSQRSLRLASLPSKSVVSKPTPKKIQGLVKNEMRLNQYIAHSGVGSRRQADSIILNGHITVNGELVSTLGYKVRSTDTVCYKGKNLCIEKIVYILLNKPKGFITSTTDPKDRKTVMQLVDKACKERIYPVGRLDRNTTGLLLFTNDGELANKLGHPSFKTSKIYKVSLNRPLSHADAIKITTGITLEEGTVPIDDFSIVDAERKIIGIALHIGWNRVIRRLFKVLDYEVLKLDRVMYANLDKKHLPRGKWRHLKDMEVNSLKHQFSFFS